MLASLTDEEPVAPPIRLPLLVVIKESSEDVVVRTVALVEEVLPDRVFLNMYAR